ncbi:hypothetical protein ACLOJK_015981 [Asimina triloba]
MMYRLNGTTTRLNKGSSALHACGSMESGLKEDCWIKIFGAIGHIQTLVNQSTSGGIVADLKWKAGTNITSRLMSAKGYGLLEGYRTYNFNGTIGKQLHATIMGKI